MYMEQSAADFLMMSLTLVLVVQDFILTRYMFFFCVIHLVSSCNRDVKKSSFFFLVSVKMCKLFLTRCNTFMFSEVF